jgi:hypothetical protein
MLTTITSIIVIKAPMFHISFVRPSIPRIPFVEYDETKYFSAPVDIDHIS